ncbi:alkaline phosphatase PhoX [Roseomonas sp. HF4]|uniref:alkaline phosphatase PhoX n=1 Tax=Roseomonas sp. HF4 TaxID=2562313 RepID=UPI001484E3F3|nr:alkaline phosphatase PhoX [Roseomonas sp. HF4]
MIGRRALLAAPAVLAAPALRAQALAIRQDDQVAPGWTRGVVVRWGDRVTFDAPAWTPEAPSLAAAAAQFGWDARILAVLPAPPADDGLPRLLLAVGHPEVDPAMAFPGGRDQPEVAGAMQGATILNLVRRGGAWVVVDGGYQNRRLTAATLCRLGADGGPALGIVGVTGGCATPWGSLLLAEGRAAAWRARLPAIDGQATGMVVEVDALDPVSVPVRHPALGRIGAVDVAAARTPDGRAVVWLTDGRAGGFLYRFVSDGGAGPRALDAGRMAAARMDGSSLRFVPLGEGDPFAAARLAGATPLGGARGLAFDPTRQRLCVALNDGAGRVLDLRMAAGDAAAETGAAETLLVGREAPAEAPRRGAAPAAAPAWPWAPAALGFDGEGALLLATDRGARPGALPEALYRVPTEGPDRGQPGFLYGAPVGAAMGGAAAAADGTVFAAVAHPGAAPGAAWAQPATRWPNMRPDEPPRSTIVMLSR